MSDEEGTDDTLAGSSGGGTSSGRTAAERAADSSASHHRLEFYIGDNLLPYDMTVYQAVQQFGAPIFEISDSDSENRNALGGTLKHHMYNYVLLPQFSLC
jgi:E3 ubiquitin-protein ligase TRIP12